MNPTSIGRRRILAGGAAAAVLALAACQNAPTGDTIAGIVQQISDGLGQAWSLVQQIPGVTIGSDVIAQVTGALASIQNDAASLASAIAPDTATLQRIAAGVKLVADVLAPFLPEAPIIGAILSAALSLLPSVLALVGIQTATRARFLLDPATSRAILRAAQ